MRALIRSAIAVLLLSVGAEAVSSPDEASWVEPYRRTAEQLISVASSSSAAAWNRLAEVTDTFGPRLSGSANLEQAIQWAVRTMEKDGLANVRLQKVKVPRWIRGAEGLDLIEPIKEQLPMLGLGGSVATPTAGIEAEVFVVRSFNELRSKAAKARGKIVLFNVAYVGYRETVAYRTSAADAAARAGGIAALVRSIGPPGLRTPHTGALRYAGSEPAIPAAAIAAEDSDRFQRLQDRGQRIVVRLHMESHFAEESDSANVIAELVGREKPEEIVLLGGHFDSWDVGTGASDDAVGCIVTWEAVRILKSLEIVPRRTIRLVLWTNEENGVRGGRAYRDEFRSSADQHVFALESDSGVFPPIRLAFNGSDQARARLNDIASLLKPLGLESVGFGGGGADIDPIVQAGGVPAMSLNGDPARYFPIHHTPADTVERIDSEDMARAAAAIAVVTYVVAEMPDRLH